MDDTSRAILDAALLTYSKDELRALGPQQRPLLFARISRHLREVNPHPSVSEMRELRRQMEATHFHPALSGFRRS